MTVVGCATSYRLGPVNPAISADQAVEVGLFHNTTRLPGLAESINAFIRRELQRDGTFTLATDDEGDVLLTGSIDTYRRSPVSFQPRDTLSVRDFEVELVTRVRAAEKATGQVLIDRELTGRTTVRLGGDLASAERQALPLLANDLAKQTVALLAEGGW
ncbi:MAG: LPS assembly lipoprotein LptE [Verrucomicrobiota bacterium]|nr:LPS assembly lipoprotein LptE [Verrucomicrobiota bacterium]